MYQSMTVLSPLNLRLPAPGSTVVAALSGGVDSAVAAALLVEAGYRVVGMTMRLYNAQGTRAAQGRCCGPRDIDDARAVADQLGIPHYIIDLEEDFSRTVVDNFVDAYLEGETPNPCVKCNQYIKFTPLLQQAVAIGGDSLVTGHYAKIADTDGDLVLARGADPEKDQAYFLFSLPTESLRRVYFPLGAMDKTTVRAHAVRLGLPVAQKAESQEICFVPDGNYSGFVAKAALRRGRTLPGAGAIVDQEGRVLGQHAGTHNYTIGQHKGLGNLTTRERMFVTAVDPASGTVTVGPREAALHNDLVLRDVRWLTPPQGRLVAGVQVRHRGEVIACEATFDGATARVRMDGATVAAPGQAAVLFDGDRVLAGGWVAKSQRLAGPTSL